MSNEEEELGSEHTKGLSVYCLFINSFKQTKVWLHYMKIKSFKMKVEMNILRVGSKSGSQIPTKLLANSSGIS